ncbi:effector-associated domain 2-containing protein [Kitasatospora purpeofusca]|uniref:effector-associated domain 2-containing protein n=1 Tax=Kitasatospora purpeofusca TaxID=67352 RepID=UPI00225A3AA0|nr:trypsin-like peptidase domain-containing protein [Kitasatospora purpeofusca]MCX4756065.1 trypsin-like peptidase domain-containing protein [Kitasatospora purpeofusca]WSR36094.1 trypsin-like peptidase domain-containing protein [Kitasatospora purpeofusca]WSR44381.1 trypsin-like peptidase domain-containing protein [Kitasatospora purpeofusca]
MTVPARPDLATTEALRRSTVVITVAGGFRGSGFLVAPGLAVTAAHVVARAARAAEPVGVRHESGEHAVPPDRIRLAPETGEGNGSGNGSGFYPFPDLALLGVPDWAGHPVVRLAAAEAEPDTVLTALGYSTHTPSPGVRPDTLRLRVVGLADRYLGVRGDGIRDGHSGSMLVDGDGLVRGVLKGSRSFQRDEGGWYTPVGALTALLGTAGVAPPGPLAPPGNGELVDALMAFELLRRADGRYDLLYTMGAHLGLTHSFEAEERPDRRTHLHQIVRACRSFRDGRSALRALRTAMAELAPDDGALDALDAVVGRALGEREDG